MVAYTPAAPGRAARLRLSLSSLGPAALALVLAAVAMLLGWRGVDQAAQTYRVLQYQLHGLMLWDSGWYAGNFPLGYSVLFPPVAALLGTGAVAVASAAVATWSFDRFVRTYLGARPLGTWYFAVSTLLPVAIGQWPFLAGEAAGLAALVSLQRGRRAVAVGLGLAAALFSPLAAAFLGLGCLAWAVCGSASRKWVFATAAVCGMVIVAIGVLFPGDGPMPFTWQDLVTIELLCLTTLTPLVRTTPTVRAGALIYAAASFVSFLVPNPLGGNAPRLAESVGVPLLVCLVTAPGPALSRLSPAHLLEWRSWGRSALSWRGWRYAAALAVVPFAVWQWAPSMGVVTSPSAAPYTRAAFYRPLVAELKRVAPGPVRVEVVPTLDHWESAFVAPYVPLARGWERQLDIADNPIFYKPGALTPKSYGAWLRAEGISYVALPAAPLDYAAKAEGAMLSAHRVADLSLVWSTRDWKLWRVTDSPGLVSGPAKLVSLEPDHLTVDVRAAGAVTVRVRYTKFWWVSSGSACVVPDLLSPAPSVAAGGTPPFQWTTILAQTPGTVELSASVVHPPTPPACAGASS